MNLFMVWMLILSMAALSGAHAAVDKVTSSTLAPIHTPSAPIPPEALLDVGIPPLNDGLALTDEDDTVFPEVRNAETIYFSNQLAKTMEKSGAWGAIRVVPSTDVVMDVYITGTILQSDGETLDLEIRVYRHERPGMAEGTPREGGGKIQPMTGG